MNCPECKKEMRWLSDDQYEDIISHFYDCVDCGIELTKNKKEESTLSN